MHSVNESVDANLKKQMRRDHFRMRYKAMQNNVVLFRRRRFFLGAIDFPALHVVQIPDPFLTMFRLE